jgi:hypothetical protein
MVVLNRVAGSQSVVRYLVIKISSLLCYFYTKLVQAKAVAADPEVPGSIPGIARFSE